MKIEDRKKRYLHIRNKSSGMKDGHLNQTNDSKSNFDIDQNIDISPNKNHLQIYVGNKNDRYQAKSKLKVTRR